MRILDVDLQNVLSKLSREELDLVEQEVSKKRFSLKSGSLGIDTNPFYSTDDLREAVANAIGSDRASAIDDDKAIADIKDEDEKNWASVNRDVTDSFGRKSSVRKIPKFAIESLIGRAKMMNRGQAYISSISGLSYDELQKLDPISDAMKGPSGDQRHTTDPKYGINAFDKSNILDILKAKAELQKYVNNIPKSEFGGLRKQFEESRNNPSMSYESPQAEEIAMLNTLFGKDESIGRIKIQNYINMVDIYEAFEEREKSIGSKTNNGIFAKIKSFFSSLKKSKKVEALPEGRDSAKSERDEFLASTKVSPEEAKYTISENNRGNQDKGKSDDLIK